MFTLRSLELTQAEGPLKISTNSFIAITFKVWCKWPDPRCPGKPANAEQFHHGIKLTVNNIPRSTILIIKCIYY